MRVRYYGHVGSLSGYGRAAADTCMALLSTGKVELEISPIDYRPDQARIALAGNREVLVRHCRRQEDLSEPDVVIVHTLPGDAVAALRAAETDGLPPGPAAVAYTTWEGISAPRSILAGYEDFDQIWMPSSPAMKAFTAPSLGDARTGVVRVIPHAFDVRTLEERRTTTRGVDTTFRFYYIGAWNSRKNPAGLLRAWALAFGSDYTGMAGPTLTLHCPGASQEQFAVALHQTGLKAQDMAPVTFSNQHISESEILKMHASYDCFVTASRGEAWNLPAFDAMLARRMIISPRGLGSDDYLENTSAMLVNGQEMPATVDVQVTGGSANGIQMRTVGAQELTSRCLWVEPDLVALACCMSDAYHHRFSTLTPHYDVTRYSYEAVGKLALTALQEI